MSTTSWAPSTVRSNHSGMPPAIQGYKAFELLVASKTTDGYPVTITRAPAGEATAVCRLDPAADDLQLALERIEAGDTADGFLAEFGRCLFDALFPAPIATLYRASLGMAVSTSPWGITGKPPKPPKKGWICCLQVPARCVSVP